MLSGFITVWVVPIVTSVIAGEVLYYRHERKKAYRNNKNNLVDVVKTHRIVVSAYDRRKIESRYIKTCVFSVSFVSIAIFIDTYVGIGSLFFALIGASLMIIPVSLLLITGITMAFNADWYELMAQRDHFVGCKKLFESIKKGWIRSSQ